MNKQDVAEALKAIKADSQKRNFNQSIDLIINFKGIDLKKADHQLDFYSQLHFGKGKKVKVGGFVGPELAAQAKEVLDAVITIEEFSAYDKKKVKILASSCDYFIAQANVMSKVAQAFGKVLGPIGKMPDPKAGCVVPPNANIKQLYEKLQKTINISVKQRPLYQCSLGGEKQAEEEIIDNAMTIYNQIVQHLPAEKQNIKSIYLKLTMGKPYRVDQKEVEGEQQ